MIESANQIIDKLKVHEQLDLNNAATGPQIKIRIQNKTADYTVVPQDSGTVFHNVGDTGAIVYTLPAPLLGLFFIFISGVDQSMTVNAATADTMITYNDVDADGVAFSTSSQKAGACLLVVGTGAYWLAVNLGTHTATVTT